MRVLFTSLPQSRHFNPLVPIARAKREAGHAVAFACPTSFALTDGNVPPQQSRILAARRADTGRAGHA